MLLVGDLQEQLGELARLGIRFIFVSLLLLPVVVLDLI